MELLKQIKILRAIVRRWQEVTAERYAKLQKTTKDITIPKVQIVGSNKDDSGLWDAYLESQEHYKKALTEYKNTETLVMRIIDRLDDPLLSDLLFYKYVDETPRTWQELAQVLYLSERHVYNAHEKAIEEFERLLQDES